jgi:hypothetical protein
VEALLANTGVRQPNRTPIRSAKVELVDGDVGPIAMRELNFTP